MAADNFESTSLGWQIQLLQQQAQEWGEYTFANLIRGAIAAGVRLPDWLYEVFVLTAWGILGLVTIWLGLLLFRAVREYMVLRTKLQNPITSNSSPTMPSYSADQWLKFARQFQLKGNYAEACRALYLGMLQLLSDRQLIAEQPSRTDGEYRFLVSALASSENYQVLIATHEDLCFSDRPISSEIFHQCQTAYHQISQ